MSKKKIGLLSVYNHNYGSILQAYALQNVLQSLGHSTEIIRYKKTNYIKQAQRLFYVPLLKATVAGLYIRKRIFLMRRLTAASARRKRLSRHKRYEHAQNDQQA